MTDLTDPREAIRALVPDAQMPLVWEEIGLVAKTGRTSLIFCLFSDEVGSTSVEAKDAVMIAAAEVVRILTGEGLDVGEPRLMLAAVTHGESDREGADGGDDEGERGDESISIGPDGDLQFAAEFSIAWPRGLPESAASAVRPALAS